MAGTLLGAVWGSFIATWVIRAGRAQSVTGRSACDGCGRTLAIGDLVPLVSWAMQRGRCRTCQARIDPLHPATEAVAAIIGGLCLWHAPNGGGAALFLLGLLLLSLALFDARHFWLPHKLSATTALAGLLFGGIATASLGIDAALIDRLIGCASGFALLWLIGAGYKMLRGRDGVGGGDAPMLAALGAWLGWAALPMLLLFAALAGLAVAVTRLVKRDHRVTHDWRLMRLPLGTLLALATPPTLWLLAHQ